MQVRPISLICSAKTKEVRFPKDFVKAFDGRLKAVVMQQDRSRGDAFKTDAHFQQIGRAHV